MAAIFKIKTEEFEFDKQWHVGFDPAFSNEEIQGIQSVQIDGDEASFLYGFGMDLIGRVHELVGNEAKLYYLLIKTLYHDSPKYQNRAGKIDNYLSGLDQPERN